MNKKILVISGGSGNSALLEGLWENGCDDKNINILVNAYDDGKSTGVCRDITGTLGASDIRKNHWKVYKLKYKNKVSEFYRHLYEDRVDLSSGYRNALTGNKTFDSIIMRFFNSSFFKNHDLKDLGVFKNFNIINIIYSQLYKEIGYEATNKLMCGMLGIENCVHLNSFDNIKIVATTENNCTLTDEGQIVTYGNFSDHIYTVHYIGKSYELNKTAIDLICNADSIIISSGTYWSSIYPTLDYLNLSKYINRSDAVKLWFMNTDEDLDTLNVSSSEIVRLYAPAGLNLDDVIIIQNLHASTERLYSIPEDAKNLNIINAYLGNINGKHDPELLGDFLDGIIYE